MNFLQKNYYYVIAILLVVGVTIGGLYLIQNLRKANGSLVKEIEEKRAELREYELQPEKAPTVGLLAELSREKNALESEYQTLEEKFQAYADFNLPKGEKFPSLYFKEILYVTLDNLVEKTEKKGVKIPSSIGFSETGLPPNDQIPDLLLQLDVVKKLLDVIIESKISTVNSLAPGSPASVAFYKEIPMDLTISDKNFNIAKFLEELGKSSSIFILDALTLTKKGDILEAKLKIKAMVREK